MRIAIISGATKDYYDKLIILYKSLRQFHKNIYFIAYNIGDKRSDIKKNTYFKNVRKKNIDPYLIYHKDKINFINEEHKKAYSSNIRIKYLLNNYNNFDAVFWMDADSIIIKPLNDFFYNLNKFNVFAHDKFTKYSTRENSRYLSGIIGFKKSIESSFILNRWYNHLFKLKDTEWLWGFDQKYLKIFLDLAKKNFKDNFHYNFPYTYISWLKFNQAYIIVGKGSKKYSKEYLKYEKNLEKFKIHL